MKQKKLLAVIGSACLILVLAVLPFMTACPAPEEEVPPTPEWEGVTFKLSDPWPPPEVSPVSLCAYMWGEEVTKRTNGKVKFEYFWGGALGKGPQHFTLVSEGAVDVILTYPWYTPSKVPLQCFEYTFPFGPTDPWIVYQAKRDIIAEFPDFTNNLAKYNIKNLFQVAPTVYTMLTTVPINTIADLEGLKIGVIGGYFGRWMEPVGISPVIVPGYERYTMLETGILDGTMDPTAFTHGLMNWEQAPYLLENKIITPAWICLWINMDSWNSLPKDIQDILEEVSVDIAEEISRDLAVQWDNEIFDYWKAHGITTTRLSDAEMAEWARACPDTAAEWAQDMEDLGYPGWEIVKRWQELTAQYGWEWPKQWGVK